MATRRERGGRSVVDHQTRKAMTMSDPTTKRAARSDLPGTGMPSSFTDLVDKSLARTKDAHEKMTRILESMTEAFQEAFSCANKGSSEYRMKVMEIARAQADAAFDVARDAMAVKSPAELVDLSATHARKQFELAAEQMKDLAALTQRVVNETAAPIRTGMTEPFRLAS
jgi:phasin